MSMQRACDICHMYRQRLDGTAAVLRYGLSRQIPVPGKFRTGRLNSLAVKRERSFGGIDLCDECFDRVARPKMRPARPKAS